MDLPSFHGTLLGTSCKGESHRLMCIYNKGNLLEESIEGGATKLVPPRLARKANRDQRIRDEMLRKKIYKKIVGGTCRS